MPGRFPLVEDELTDDAFCNDGFGGLAGVGVAVTVAPTSVVENEGVPFVFTFTLEYDLQFDTIISYTMLGTAINGVDYTGSAIFGTKTIYAGSTTATLIITPVADALIEGNETVIVKITNTNCNGDVLAVTQPMATGQITDPPWRPLPSTANRIAFDVIADSSVAIPCDGGAGEVPASTSTGNAGIATAPFPFIEVGNLVVTAHAIGPTVGEVRCSCDSSNYRPTVSVPIRSAAGVTGEVIFSYPQGNCAEFIITGIRQVSRTRSINFYQMRLINSGGAVIATLPPTGGVVPP